MSQNALLTDLAHKRIFDNFYLAGLQRISLNILDHEAHSHLQARLDFKLWSTGLWFLGGLHTSPSQLDGVLDEPGTEDAGEVASRGRDHHLGKG